MASKRNSKELKFPGMKYRPQPHQRGKKDSGLTIFRAQPGAQYLKNSGTHSWHTDICEGRFDSWTFSCETKIPKSSLSNLRTARQWWHMPLITALSRHRQLYLYEFDISLVYRVSSRTAKVTL